jgi:hypothetical protein
MKTMFGKRYPNCVKKKKKWTYKNKYQEYNQWWGSYLKS